MKSKYRRLRTRFGPETGFEVKPVSAAPFRAVLEDRFEGLKARLLLESLDTVWQPELNSEVRRAANEAAAIAWITPYPLLVFPILFEEKTRSALGVAARQERVRERTRELIAI